MSGTVLTKCRARGGAGQAAAAGDEGRPAEAGGACLQPSCTAAPRWLTWPTGCSQHLQKPSAEADSSSRHRFCKRQRVVRGCRGKRSRAACPRSRRGKRYRRWRPFRQRPAPLAGLHLARRAAAWSEGGPGHGSQETNVALQFTLLSSPVTKRTARQPLRTGNGKGRNRDWSLKPGSFASRLFLG